MSRDDLSSDTIVLQGADNSTGPWWEMWRGSEEAYWRLIRLPTEPLYTRVVRLAADYTAGGGEANR